MYIDWIRIYQRGDANQSFSAVSVSDPIEPENPQGTHQAIINDEQQITNKILHNGQLLIRRGEHIYTITGQIVK